MFTGLIEGIGRVIGLQRRTSNDNKPGAILEISAPLEIAQSLSLGDSLNINGCCLTVISKKENVLGFDLLQETVDKTNFHALHEDSIVNLERSLAANGRLGGHFVQGHVDAVGKVLTWEQAGADYKLQVQLPEELSKYVAYKGSIALNGISLTVAEVTPKTGAAQATCTCWIIPHTLTETNLSSLKQGDYVNIEFDILAKYVERQLATFSIQKP